MTLGLWIRNNWLRAPNSPLRATLAAIRPMSTDTMSGLIISALCHDLVKTDFEVSVYLEQVAQEEEELLLRPKPEIPCPEHKEHLLHMVWGEVPGSPELRVVMLAVCPVDLRWWACPETKPCRNPEPQEIERISEALLVRHEMLVQRNRLENTEK